ncbi:hypothetical protein JKF63_00625 [Porcisia hertigi]|uniref:Uncharacterized protein n=1 Tax=Porcisia hertigi TaxID=2761500 RepID=A0A836L180_9TRYP|nr:hypothetical protein JKF63_00625 [Porcisia hertigi]
MVESQSSGAISTRQLSLFSVLGGAITRATLQQVQRDVDVLCSVSSSLRASPSSGATRPVRVPASEPPPGASDSHPLRRVLDALRAAHVGGLTGGGNDGAPPQSDSTLISVRDVLIHAFGVSAGSSLYREWVQAPRRRIQRVVHQLAMAVRERYLPVLTECCALSKEESIDVHVQLYPSAAIPQTAVPVALRESQGFFAAVTVRRLSALEEEVLATRRLRQRYMEVAAQGQTLSSALSFWADVSYGDVPPALLVDHPPLGFEEEGRRLTAEAVQTAATNAAAPDRDRQRGRKTQRATDEEDDPRQPALLLGVREDSETLAVAPGELEREGALDWLQPLPLLWTGDEACYGQCAGATTASDAAPAHHIRYEGVGLLAMVYVHSSGMAYVGYPQSSETASGGTCTDSFLQPHRDVPPAGPLTATPPLLSSQQPPLAPTCSLSMSSSTGFVRSLLGLS